MLLTELKDFKTKLEYHHKLNPALWDGDVLKPEVLAKLREIADQFLETLEVPASSVVDVSFTGSNTNYNWTELSDIDLHLILDMKDLDVSGIDAKKSLWNERHTVTINGFPVEVYAEDSKQHNSDNAGRYSIKDKKWVKEPKFENIKFDYDKIKGKAAKWMVKIDKLIASKTTDVAQIKKFIDTLRASRQKDLAKGGEFTMENLVFKALRNNGYMEKLYSFLLKTEDENLSLK